MYQFILPFFREKYKMGSHFFRFRRAKNVKTPPRIFHGAALVDESA